MSFQVHLPVELAVSGIHPVFSTTGYNVELILQTEVPHVYSAFRMSGYTPSQVMFMSYSGAKTFVGTNTVMRIEPLGVSFHTCKLPMS